MNCNKEYLLIKVENRQYFVKAATGEILAKNENGPINPSFLEGIPSNELDIIVI